MNETTTQGNGNAGQTLAPVSLLGTVWRHRKKGGIYHVTELAPERGNVYLRAETKGCRSTWKAECLLPYDYEQVPNAAISDTPTETSRKETK
jgi:hypothetical protein